MSTTKQKSEHRIEIQDGSSHQYPLGDRTAGRNFSKGPSYEKMHLKRGFIELCGGGGGARINKLTGDPVELRHVAAETGMESTVTVDTGTCCHPVVLALRLLGGSGYHQLTATIVTW